MEKTEFIEFELIRSSINISCHMAFQSYLQEVYNDLAVRSNKAGVRKLAFYEYLKFPVFVSERIFNSFDKDGNEILNLKEFTEGLFSLYIGDFEDTAKIIFNIYDHDKDGLIYKGDVKVLLSYLPLKSEMDKLSHQLESLEELDKTINETFGKENTLNLKKFIKVIEEVKSDIYLLPICFLYNNKPFEENKINLLKNLKKRKSSSLCTLSRKNELSKKRFPSPFKSTKFSSIENLIEYANKKKKSQSPQKTKTPSLFNKMKSSPEPIKRENKEMIRMNNKKIVNDQEIKYLYHSPTNYFKDKGQMPDEFNLEPIECSESGEYPVFLVDSTSKKLIKYFLVLVGKEISIYNSDAKTDLIYFHNLSGCMIKEELSTPIFLKIKYYCFSIIFCKSITKTFYFTEKSDMNDLVSMIKKSIGYHNFDDIYEISSEIGSGKFGIVSLAIHKQTGMKVAVKTFKKSNIESLETELIKSEIDQMKIFRHPNLVRLLDHFENIDYIYIVMEYLEGGDLYTKISQDGPINEEKAARIIYEVALGINYLNSLNIMHRDLKLENIMFVDNSENSGIKIIDFGMTKTFAPGEKVYEKLGTINYIAPEVLIKKPYDKQVDMWSLGVILYVMLCGSFPFCNKDESDETVVRNTLSNQPDFNYFSKISKSAIKLIDQCLEKEPNNRITCGDFLKSDWVNKYR